ncbi:hypothetical protein Cgig2_011871 [Carnegiea gigantea]|uniref:Uncharacterized protein n=1 Tax=Carnegiea gigantea TaxID=171969 RepID=A0A9Q1QDV8_9CARY|nr:hypothetical protein Cgig2_011871 [Carnegiea gigantea]
MGVTIYGDDIASYAAAIKCRKEYEISNAVVKPLKRHCKGKETLLVSVWNDLATGSCEELVSIVESLPVVSLTALKISRHAGFSFSTTMSTLMNLHPGGEKAKQLSFENGSHLKSLREAVEGAKVSVKKAVLWSISDFKAMKGENTMHGQCIWICGCIQNLDKKMIRLYLGCDACGTKTYEDTGTKYKCSKSSCTARTSTAVAGFL